jgi:eukaryotic-like serine/threonine-protein kinase
MGLNLMPTVVLPEPDLQIERTGAMVGRYKLLEQIGEGGFGVVFMAEQQEPVRRKVALKVIKAGMDTKEVIARFEAERQALALMDHPNIARVLDGGTTAAGRPYFVMELVRGITITDYCDQANLSMRDRLQLFIKVCQAVQHAHQKGIIHRDLKPSNVLVALHDGEPVPKVIDFGVAKALGQKLTEKTLFTRFHHMIGTPAYMCPEQAALSGLDIDTRADIYSLGILLYELLTGATPFDADIFRKAALDEVRRLIHEAEPPKPSTRLQTLGDRLADVARHRGTEPTALGRLIRGDLDWIVMKCLEKDRQRRYETASGLAMDLQRYLTSEPIVARPPSTAYRMQKFVRRHKLGFAALTAVGTALALGVAGSAWQALRATRAEHMQNTLRLRAEDALAQVQIQTAVQLFGINEHSTALAYLARALRLQPANPTVATQVFSILKAHNFVLPLSGPLKHAGEVRYAQFSPDCRRVVTASWDGTARVWNSVTGEPITPPLPHKGNVNRARFDPSGTRVVTASEDGTARVWDANTGRPLTPILECGAKLYDAGFTPDGKRIFTADNAGQASMWDAQSGEHLKQPIGVGNPVQRIARPFSPDGQRYISREGTNAFIRDLTTGERLVGPLALGEPGTVSNGFSRDGYTSGEFSANGLQAVTTGRTARIWDALTGSLIHEVKEEGPIFMAHLSADGELLLTLSTAPDYTAQVWKAKTARALSGPLDIGRCRAMQFAPSGHWVLSAAMGEAARLWDAATGQLITQPVRVDGLYWAELSGNGEYLVTTSRDGNARVWTIRIGYNSISTPRTAVPDWVPGLLEAMAKKRLNDPVGFEAIDFAQLEEFRHKLSTSSETNAWALWAKWILASPSAPPPASQ